MSPQIACHRPFSEPQQRDEVIILVGDLRIQSLAQVDLRSRALKPVFRA